jgi:pyruvate carboxylase
MVSFYSFILGESRVVAVIDEEKGKEGRNSVVSSSRRPKADKSDKYQISCPMAGLVVEMRVKEGSEVKVGDAICVLSAMKMETIVNSAVAGVVSVLAALQSDNLAPGDLIAKITPVVVSELDKCRTNKKII